MVSLNFFQAITLQTMAAYFPLCDLLSPCFRLRGFTPAEDEADWPILASSELERSFVRLFRDINTQ